MKTTILILLFTSCIGQLAAQYIPIQEKYWVVADSMQFEFNSSGLPTITTSPFRSHRKAGATYLDSITGFYCYSNGLNFWDSSNQIMFNCIDSIPGSGFYKNIFIPSYTSPDTLYHIGINFLQGYPLFLTTINTSMNNGLGSIVATDTFEDEFDYNPITSLDYDTSSFGARFIKHGDGKQWWVLYHHRKFGSLQNSTNPTWIRWLFNNGTVTGPYFQDIGLWYGYDLYFNPIAVSESGTKVAVVSWANSIELLDFDRCTGLLSNPVVLDSGFVFDDSVTVEKYQDSGYISCAFSAAGNYLYVNSFDTLYQFDLLASNIADSRMVIWYDTNDVFGLILGMMELGPDGRIYVGTCKRQNLDAQNQNGDYTRNKYNTWMGIIDKPDLEGISCDFKRYALFLDGHISNGTTPVRSNTQLGVWVGSPCDPNVTGEAPDKDLKTKVKIFPNPANDKLNITWSVQGGYTWALKSIAGVTLNSGTQQVGNAIISTANLPEGMYFLEVHSAKEHKVEKVIVVR